MTHLLPTVVVALCFVGHAYAATCPPGKTAQNPDATPCDCGRTAKCNKDEYCDSAGSAGDGTCSAVKFCPDDKNTQITDASCKCNTQTCTQNQYCDVSTTAGACIPACPADKAIKITDPTCGCSKKTCNSGQYCDTTGDGTCNNDAPPPACPARTTKITVAQCTCNKKTCVTDDYCDTAGDSGKGACDKTPPPALPACPTDKATKITVAQCTCKTQTCVMDDYCDMAGDSGNGACDKTPPTSVKACPTDKATKITDATCTCSKQTCTTGQYCDSTGDGKCSTTPPTTSLPACPAPPNPATADCQCGSATCKIGDKCTSGVCSQDQDLDPDCFRYGGLCNNPVYKATMEKNCAVTCARQSGSLPPAPCLDRNVNCPTWPNFCQNSFYTNEQKKYYCQKSCNMC